MIFVTTWSLFSYSVTYISGQVSKSVGDLSCVSQKSLSWADKDPANQKNKEEAQQQCEPTQFQDSQSVSEDTKSDRQSEGTYTVYVYRYVCITLDSNFFLMC